MLVTEWSFGRNVVSVGFVIACFMVGCQTTQKPEMKAAAAGGHPLYRMVRLGDLPSLESWVKEGKPFDEPNNVGVTPVMVASRFGNLETVKYLLKMGAKADRLDRDDQGPLTYALGGPSEESKMKQIVSELLKAGADPFVIDKLGFQPIRAMIEDGWSEIVLSLEFAGADGKSCGRAKLRRGEESFSRLARRTGNEPLAFELEKRGCW